MNAQRLILLASFAAATLGYAQGKNLVPNPGFEEIQIVDHVKQKDGLEFDCQVVQREGDTIYVKTRAATVPKKTADIEKITKRNTAAQWTFYEIKLPVADVLDTSQGHRSAKSLKLATTRGKGFMHSAVFDVAAGKRYEVSAWIKGKGKATLHMLWWTKYTAEEIGMCKHHLDATDTVQATSEWQPVRKTFQAPEGATKAYVRLIAEDGDVWFDDVSVMEQ